MKRWTVLIGAVLLAALLLCGCMQKTGEAIKDDMATMASEVKDNIDGMIENGTVGDGDGYIGDRSPTSRATEPTEQAVTETETVGEDMTDAADESPMEDASQPDDAEPTEDDYI